MSKNFLKRALCFAQAYMIDLRQAVWAFGACFLSFFLPIQAQERAPGGVDSIYREQVLSTVLVTARKQPEKLMSIGKNLFAVPYRQLHHSEATSLSQLLHQTGLTISGAYSNPSATKSVFIRGASSQYSLLLFDGVPVLDPSVPSGVYNLYMLPRAALSSIEIMRGSYSTLYGSGAVAGVVNLRSKLPATDKAFQVEGYATGGSLNSLRTALGLSGTVLRPQVHALGLAYRVDLARQQSTGISEARPPINDPGLSFDKDGFYRNTLSTSVALRYKNFFFRPYFRHAFNQQDLDAGAHKDHLQHTQRGDMNMGGINMDWQYAEKAHLQLKIAQQNSFRNYKKLNTEASTWKEDTYQGQMRFMDVYTNYMLHKQVTFLGGVAYRYEKMRVPSDPMPQVEQLSPYAVWYVQPFRGLPMHLELGARLNKHTRYGTHLSYDLNPFYVLGKHTKVYASYATSFLAPSLFSLYSQDYGNPNLQPERSESVEVGTMYQPELPVAGQVKWAWRGAAFYRKIDDVVAWQFSNEFSGPINRDKQEDRGLELEPSVYIATQWQIDLAYAFVFGKQYIREEGKPRAEYNLIRRPKHSYRAQIQWTPSSKWMLRANIQALGERLDTHFSASEQVTLSSYGLLDLYASYTFFEKGSIQAFLDAKNIFDQSNYTEALGYEVPGRLFMLGLHFTY